MSTRLDDLGRISDEAVTVEKTYHYLVVFEGRHRWSRICIDTVLIRETNRRPLIRALFLFDREGSNTVQRDRVGCAIFVMTKQDPACGVNTTLLPIPKPLIQRRILSTRREFLHAIDDEEDVFGSKEGSVTNGAK